MNIVENITDYFGSLSSLFPSLGFPVALTVVIALGLAASKTGASDSDVQPLRILFVTGGGFHDFSAQKEILTEGIGNRLHVDFEIDHDAGGDPTSVPPRFVDPDFAKGYDLVLYNISLSREQNPETAQAIIDSHVKHGVPAIIVHGTVHSYRHTGNENWFDFIGGRSMWHQSQRPFANEVLEADHPVMAGFPNPWQQSQGELYVIEELMPGATALAHGYGVETEKHHPTIWVNEYKGVRVFTTTIGHHNETMSDPVYLDLISRAIVWATEK